LNRALRIAIVWITDPFAADRRFPR
jgi:hypothetical protein